MRHSNIVTTQTIPIFQSQVTKSTTNIIHPSSNFNLRQFQLLVTEKQNAFQSPGQVLDALYQDDGKYRGTLINGIRIGRGDYFFPNGDYYNGFWQNDMFNGIGLYKYKNNQKAYFGQFLNNQPHGKGTLTIDGKSPVVIYDGEWEQGMKSGKGIEFYSHSPVEYYDGNWMGGMKNGMGMYCYPDGSVYRGQWVGNKKHGKGEFVTKQGTVFRGIWNNDHMQSNIPIHIQYPKNISSVGTIFDSYQGTHIGGARNGKGLYRFNNGNQGINEYVGDYTNNKKFGVGTYTTSFGDKYVGSFVDGRKQGENGRYVWADGSTYVGRFEGDGLFGGVFVDSKDGEQRNIVNGKVQVV